MGKKDKRLSKQRRVSKKKWSGGAGTRDRATEVAKEVKVLGQETGTKKDEHAKCVLVVTSVISVLLSIIQSQDWIKHTNHITV